MPYFPRARSARLLTERLNDEILLFDQDQDVAHCLQADLARVWECCDGQHSVPDIAAALGLTEIQVEAAVTELGGQALLEAAPELEGYSRRDAAKRIAKIGAGVAAAPLVYSLAIGPAAAMATPGQCAAVSCASAGNQTAANNQCSNDPKCQTGSVCVNYVKNVSGTCQF